MYSIYFDACRLQKLWNEQLVKVVVHYLEESSVLVSIVTAPVETYPDWV